MLIESKFRLYLDFRLTMLVQTERNQACLNC